MTVNTYVDDSQRLLVYRYIGRIEMDEVINAASTIAARADRNIEYRSLLVFDRTVALSELGPDELARIKQELVEKYAKAGIRRSAGAIMVDGSMDARIIMPLWKALFDSDPAEDVDYKLFTNPEAALAWLDARETEPLTEMFAPLDGRDRKSPEQAG
ncbi:MAG: hypothetical protein JJ899_10080 [Alphaproteobacteria bacterium]|nr:hypothetical protein [Alphaproteobacteria bacterium]